MIAIVKPPDLTLDTFYDNFKSNVMCDSADSVWESLQQEESKSILDYKKRMKDIKKKRGEDIVSLMKKSEPKESKPQKSLKSKKKLPDDSARSDISTNKKYEPEDDIMVENETKIDRTVVSLAELISSINRDINCLTHDDAKIRKKSLENIMLEAFQYHELSVDDYNKLLSDLGKVLFRMFSDSSEKCRELTLKLVLQLFNSCSDFLPILGYFFTNLIQRVPSGSGYDEELEIFVTDIESHQAYKRGKAVDRQDKVGQVGCASIVVVEPSEEIRKLLCECLLTLLHRLKSFDAVTIIQPYFNEVIAFTHLQFRDPFPDVKILAGELVKTLASMPEFELGLKYFVVAMVRVILPCLRHRHSRVRLVAVEAIHSCFAVPDRDKCKSAASNALLDLIGFREENVLQVAAFYKTDILINYLAELVTDSSTAVRLAFVRFLTLLMTEIGDRLDHSSRLLPYVLDLVTDTDTTVSYEALACLQRCGQQYEDDHREEILEKRQFNIDGDSRMNLTLPFPPPFVERPRIGVRLFVRGQAKRFLLAILGELTHWTASIRVKSARLLKVLLIFCEESLTMESHILYPGYLKAMLFAQEHQDKDLSQELLQVMELVGRYCHPEVYVHYIFPRLRGDEDVVAFGIDADTRIAVFQMLQQLFAGSKACQLAPFFEEFILCLTDPFLIVPDSPRLQLEALKTLQSFLLTIQGHSPSNTSASANSLSSSTPIQLSMATMESHFLATGRLKSLHKAMEKSFRFVLGNWCYRHKEELMMNPNSSKKKNNNTKIHDPSSINNKKNNKKKNSSSLNSKDGKMDDHEIQQEEEEGRAIHPSPSTTSSTLISSTSSIMATSTSLSSSTSMEWQQLILSCFHRLALLEAPLASIYEDTSTTPIGSSSAIQRGIHFPLYFKKYGRMVIQTLLQEYGIPLSMSSASTGSSSSSLPTTISLSMDIPGLPDIEEDFSVGGERGLLWQALLNNPFHLFFTQAEPSFSHGNQPGKVGDDHPSRTSWDPLVQDILTFLVTSLHQSRNAMVVKKLMSLLLEFLIPFVYSHQAYRSSNAQFFYPLYGNADWKGVALSPDSLHEWFLPYLPWLFQSFTHADWTHAWGNLESLHHIRYDFFTLVLGFPLSRMSSNYRNDDKNDENDENEDDDNDRQELNNNLRGVMSIHHPLLVSWVGKDLLTMLRCSNQPNQPKTLRLRGLQFLQDVLGFLRSELSIPNQLLSFQKRCKLDYLLPSATEPKENVSSSMTMTSSQVDYLLPVVDQIFGQLVSYLDDSQDEIIMLALLILQSNFNLVISNHNNHTNQEKGSSIPQIETCDHNTNSSNNGAHQRKMNLITTSSESSYRCFTKLAESLLRKLVLFLEQSLTAEEVWSQWEATLRSLAVLDLSGFQILLRKIVDELGPRIQIGTVTSEIISGFFDHCDILISFNSSSR